MVSGLPRGAIYALIAIAYTKVGGISSLINFVHGIHCRHDDIPRPGLFGMEVSSGATIILCIVVLDNIGWIIRLITGVFILLPDYLRACVDYRRLVFGAVLVAKMAFRPQGLVAGGRRTYTLRH